MLTFATPKQRETIAGTTALKLESERLPRVTNKFFDRLGKGKRKQRREFKRAHSTNSKFLYNGEFDPGSG